MVKVKICGTTNEEDLNLCVKYGADAIGFVVEYPVPVPWNLDINRADELMKKVPPFVSKVCVVGDEYNKVIEIANTLRPDVIQLHGNEPIDETKRLVSEIKSLKIKVIKAIRFSVETNKPISQIHDPIRLCNILKDMGVDAVVLDAVSSSMPAGTGKRIDWATAAQIRNSIDIPLILAGGLNPENVLEAISQVKPYAVDVISGVEAERGKKDEKKIKDFILKAKKVAWKIGTGE